ncbi:MAG: ATP-binding protein [Myxococcaceae bacterium]|nr:ATP-binding protein [Myxococcaceae bacterium]MCI0670593.1 ATP-binding protein [Myxococcaceae bacterium]
MDLPPLSPGARQRALLELARKDKADLGATLRAVTEAAAVVLDVARASVWHLGDGRSTLVCDDLYVRSEGQHGTSETLHATDFPTYFEALSESRAIPAEDARVDPRTGEFRQPYLEPRGITSMLDVPVWRRGQLYGILCVEHMGPPREWRPADVDFAGNLADIVSLSLEAADRAAAEYRWEVVVDAIAEGVFVLDRDARIVMANPRARALIERAGLGITLEERMALSELRDLAGQPLPRERRPGLRALRGEVVRGEFIGAFRYRTHDTSYYRMSSAPVREGGVITSAVVVLDDVTEDVHFEKLKRDFLSALAHELKTPVAITKANAQLAERLEGLPERCRPFMTSILRAAERMQKLTDDLVDISSVLLGRFTLVSEPVDLASVAGTVVARATRAAPERLTLDAPEPVVVMGDRPRLEQVVRQLVDNALRYSHGGDVQVSVRAEDGSALLTVRDEGIGIPAEKQKRIFELFFRAHAGTPDDHGGLGLGLFLCREIVRSHGGDIGFESTEEKGSTFRVRLPLAQSS